MTRRDAPAGSPPASAARRSLLTCGAVLAAGLLLGCGGGQTFEEAESLSGKLTEDGQPRSGVRLNFWKAEGPVAGISASVVTAADGTFSLPGGPDVAPGLGLPGGQYKVTVERFGTPLPADADPDVKRNEGAAAPRNLAPQKFQDRTTTPLTVTVPGEGVTLDLSA